MKKTSFSIGILVIFIITAALIAATGCTTQQGQQTTSSKNLSTVRYGGRQYPGEYVLAGDPEIWTKYGLNVEHTLFSSGAENNEALIAGSVDINCGADSKTIALFNAMPDQIIIIGTIERGNRYTTIVRSDSNITSWDDLKGKKVATRFGTGAEAILRKYYNLSGYKWEDFDYVNLKIEDMTAALEQGQIDAFTAWEPTPAIAEAKGIGKVMMTYGNVDQVPVCLQTTKAYAQLHEDELVRFLAAHLEKADLIKNNPSEAARLASLAAAKKGITIPPEAFEKDFQRIDFSIDFDESIITNIEETAKFLYSGGQIKKLPVITYDKSYLEKAKELRSKMS